MDYQLMIWIWMVNCAALSAMTWHRPSDLSSRPNTMTRVELSDVTTSRAPIITYNEQASRAWHQYKLAHPPCMRGYRSSTHATIAMVARVGKQSILSQSQNGTQVCSQAYYIANMTHICSEKLFSHVGMPRLPRTFTSPPKWVANYCAVA